MAELGANAPSSLVSVVLAERSIAILILLAMGFGLIAPLLTWRPRPIRTSATMSADGAERVRKA